MSEPKTAFKQQILSSKSMHPSNPLFLSKDGNPQKPLMGGPSTKKSP
jgi:hypothetical protein